MNEESALAAWSRSNSCLILLLHGGCSWLLLAGLSGPLVVAILVQFQNMYQMKLWRFQVGVEWRGSDSEEG